MSDDSLLYKCAVVGIGLIGYLTPLAIVILAGLKIRQWQFETTSTRRKLWLAGFRIAAVVSFIGPLYLLGVQFLSDEAKRAWFMNVGMYSLLFALIASLLAAILAAFGRGKLRWLTVLAAFWSAAMSYVSLLALAT